MRNPTKGGTARTGWKQRRQEHEEGRTKSTQCLVAGQQGRGDTERAAARDGLGGCSGLGLGRWR